MNVFINNRDRDWYAEIGGYVREVFSDKLIGNLSFFNEKINKKPNLIKRFTDNKKDINNSIGIFFTTSELGKDNLRKMFGDPLVHKQFGEGGIKGGKYASYFININDKIVHLGYDHRGTSIEVEIEGSINDVYNYTKDQSEEYFNIIKKIVDIYYSTCSV